MEAILFCSVEIRLLSKNKSSGGKNEGCEKKKNRVVERKKDMWWKVRVGVSTIQKYVFRFQSHSESF